MSLLDLLFLPVMGPLKGMIFVAEQLTKEAERVWYDEEGIRAALLDLELRLQDGEITSDEYAVQEEQLMQRLEEAMIRKASRGRREEAGRADH